MSGLWGGLWHAKYKNVNFKAVGVTLIGSMVALVLASYVIGVLLPPVYARWYISLLVLFLGIMTVIKSFGKMHILEDHGKFSKWKCALLGAVAGFNKGGTGGGYGPLTVSGYMLLGLPAAVAIGTTTLAEGISSMAGVVSYSAFAGIVFSIAIPLAAGSFLADPISAYLNHRLKISIDPSSHKRLIGSIMLLLGIVTVLRTAGFI